MSTYIVAGATVALTATATSSGSSIAPADANSGLGGANGPTFLKVVNTSATEPVFFATAATAPTAVVPVTATNTGSNCIAPGATEFIQVATAGVAPSTVYFAVVAASSTAVYITPITLV